MTGAVGRHARFARGIALASAVLGTASAAAAGPPDARAERSAPATIRFDGEPVLELRHTVLGYSPEKRAAEVSARLERLVRSPLFRIQDVHAEDHLDLTLVFWEDELLFTVSDGDLEPGETRQEVAASAVRALGMALEHSRAARTPKSLILDAALALGVTALLVLAILGLNWGARRLRARLEGWFRLAGRKLHSYTTTERLGALAMGLVTVVRVLLILLLLYAYTPIVFSFFPWTRGWGATLLHWALDPVKLFLLAIVRYLPNVFFIVVALFLARGLTRLLEVVFGEVEAERIRIAGFYPEWARPTLQLVKVLVVVIAGVIIFPYLPGAGSPAAQGVSIFLGALVTFGSGGAIANLFAGVILTYTRAFQVGDRVRVADTYGDVIERSLLVTRVRTIKNEEVAIPNSLVMGAHILNYSAAARGKGLLLHTRVTIGYDVPWRKVHALLIAAARVTPRILAEPAPFVWQTSLDDFFVTYELNAGTDHPEVLDDTYAELHKAIRDAFDEAGVEILSPHYTSLRDGSHSTAATPGWRESPKR
jgi:small-conductance mechanosensitive channel